MAKGSKSTAAIDTTGLSKTFGSKQALSNVSFSVPYGSIFGFLGPNGAGKTTTIRCLMDFIRPSAGSVSLLGLDSRRDSTELKRRIGYLSSDSQLNPNWTGQEHIDFFEKIKGASANRAELVKRLGLDLSTKVRSLSTGNKQKLAIVLCFTGDPQLLIMDEPTRGLDPLLQNELYDILTEFAGSKKTVFFSSHNLGEVERICDAVLLVKDGRVVEEKSMASIRDMKVHMVSATTSQAFDVRRLQALPNVKVIAKTKTTIDLKIKGDFNLALRNLLMMKLTDLTVNHAGLEEVFLEQYKD